MQYAKVCDTRMCVHCTCAYTHTYVWYNRRACAPAQQIKAKKLSRLVAILVRSVTSQLELSLSLHTSLVEKKPSPFLLSIESSSWSQEGSGGQKIISELLNEAFSAKVTWLGRDTYKLAMLHPRLPPQIATCKHTSPRLCCLVKK